MVKRLVSRAGAVGAQVGRKAIRLNWSWQGLALLLLSGLLVISALAVIYSAFLYRQAFNAQQQLLQQRNALEVEWGQLLLEQSALAAHSRIETIVTRRLDMYVPSPDEIVVVR